MVSLSMGLVTLIALFPLLPTAMSNSTVVPSGRRLEVEIQFSPYIKVSLTY